MSDMDLKEALDIVDQYRGNICKPPEDKFMQALDVLIETLRRSGPFDLNYSQRLYGVDLLSPKIVTTVSDRAVKLENIDPTGKVIINDGTE